jgi:hypothetical protein
VVDLGVDKAKEAVDSKFGDSDAPNGAVGAQPPPEDPFLRTTPEV